MKTLVARLWAERRYCLAFLGLAVLVRIPTVDGWDEAFYVGQLTSLVGEGDLRLQDDVVAVPQRLSEKHRILTSVLPSGALHNTMSIGPAIVLSPFTASTIGGGQPPPWAAFRFAAAVAAMVLLLSTAALVVDAGRRFGIADAQAFAAAGLVVLGGPLAVYGTRAYLNSHLASAFLVALVLQQVLVQLERPRAWGGLGLGLAAGLACVNRWQDVVVVGPLLLAALLLLLRERRLSLAVFVLGAGGCAAAIACQMLAWRAQFGSPFLIPQGSTYMRWNAPGLLPLVASSHNGLLAWAPALAIGFVGLALGTGRRAALPPDLVRRRAFVLPALAAGVALTLYVSACPEDWWGRDSFGPRRLTSLTPVAALGLGLVLGRLPALARAVLGLALAGWGVFLVSVHFSTHHDLSLLLLGRPDPWSPNPTAALPSPPWIDEWGPLHALKPAFSLADAPRTSDRLIGLAIVAAVVLVTRLAWRAATGSRRVAEGGAVLGAALVLCWLALLAAAPANRPTDAVWLAFVEQPLEEARARALPADMSIARDVVVAVAAEAAGRADARSQAVGRLRAAGLSFSEEDLAQAAARLP